jgi:hypothetical protein
MDASEQVQTAPKNKRAGLIVCGIVEILLGLLCLLAIPVMVLGYMMQGKAAAYGGMSLVTELVMFGGLAVFFGYMGVGTMLGRRWARAIMIVVSAYWLLVGALCTGLVTWVMLNVFSKPGAAGGPLPASVVSITIAVLIVILAIFLIILPLAFLIFYRSPHVKVTCERLDPKERWTDRVPSPVLALSLLLISHAAGMLMMLPGPFIALFGYIARGWMCSLTALLASALYGVLAIYTFKRKRWAWAASLAATMLWGLSSLVTSLRMTPEQIMGTLYSAGEGIPPESVKAMQAFGQHAWAGMGFAFMILWLGFLLYVRRYFSPTQGSAGDGEAVMPPG